MYQEAALAFAMAAEQLDELALPATFGNARLKQLAVAAARFAARCAHRNGALDDYYPYEQAVGATAFALRAAIETAKALKLTDPELRDWVRRAALWLGHFDESGRLANHQALVALTLFRAGRWLTQHALIEQARRRLHRLLSWQTPEGWFPEYDGCDPGYHTVLIAFLAELWRSSGWTELAEPLRRAVEFAVAIQHPDGTIGGEHGSRNTYHCYVHGFELLASCWPAARLFLARAGHALATEIQPPLDDDRMVAHYGVDLLLARRDASAVPPPDEPPSTAKVWFPLAGIAIRRLGGCCWIVGTLKGGSFRLYQNAELRAVDTGLVAELPDGTLAATAAVPPERIAVTEDGIELSGRFGLVRHEVLTPGKQVLFRAVTFSVGRFWPNVVRRFLQRKAITGSRPVGLRYVRRIRWEPEATVCDEVWLDGGPVPRRLWLATDATFRYVAASNTFQPGAMAPWTELAQAAEKLRTGSTVVVSRAYT